ncbi:MAG: diaminopimelate decarboxylase [Verrucomicrobia bacterium]|nr:diaminopimelate decarboxylase [Verrucomicrobiota bacterium]
MSCFQYKNSVLHAEGVSLQTLAARQGTPLYVYSRSHLLSQYRSLADAMAPVQPLICYSVKACSNSAVIGTFASEGSGFDIVSGGELFRVLRAGGDASKVVFAGVGKTTGEIELALRKGILFFTVESEPEARRISDCARRLKKTGRIAFRVNPDVNPKTHKYITTGKRETKFGLDIERATRAYEMAAVLPNIEIAGIHLHIGSQILSAAPFAQSLRKVRPLCEQLKARFPAFKYMDIGGGIGIQYSPAQAPLEASQYAKAVIPLLRRLGLSVVLEPGRYLVGNSAVLVCRVQYVKNSFGRKFIVVDAGMNDLVRPALYEAYHEVSPVRLTRRTIKGDLVGPICESSDFIALDRRLPDVWEGDLLAIRSAGAYGFAMSSNYNSRPRPAEVMVQGRKACVVRERERPDDLVRGEKNPRF